MSSVFEESQNSLAKCNIDSIPLKKCNISKIFDIVQPSLNIPHISFSQENAMECV